MNINRVILTGRLTRDPGLRSTSTGTSLCELGLAVNEREKAGDEWRERANYFNVVVWGQRAEDAGATSRRRPIAVDGRLRFESWEVDGNKRSTVKIVAVGRVPPRTSRRRRPGAAEASGTSRPGDDDIPFLM